MAWKAVHLIWLISHWHLYLVEDFLAGQLRYLRFSRDKYHHCILTKPPFLMVKSVESPSKNMFPDEPPISWLVESLIPYQTNQYKPSSCFKSTKKSRWTKKRSRWSHSKPSMSGFPSKNQLSPWNPPIGIHGRRPWAGWAAPGASAPWWRPPRRWASPWITAWKCWATAAPGMPGRRVAMQNLRLVLGQK